MRVVRDERVAYPYSVGVVLAVNAVSDAWLLLDAPTCAWGRPGFVQDSHDWNSTLWRPDGFHRVQVSCTSTELLIESAWRDVPARLARMAERPGCGVVLASGFPLVTLTGVQHDAIWRSIEPPPAVPFAAVRGGRLVEDWLDGYAETLLALARGLDLRPGGAVPGDVAIVGYGWDRNEGDHAGNVAELSRMLAGIGLNLVSVWPSGGGTRSLLAASTASTVLSFPHGREAARTVAEKLGVPCVECGVPLGLQGTARWLAALAEATDRVAAARGFVEKELARAVPRVEWAVSHALEGARVGLCVDPVYLGPLADLVAETGGSVVLAIGTAGEEAMARLGPWDGLPVPVHGPVTENGLDELLDAADPIEVLVGGHRRWPEAVEVGYPSFLEHAIADRPFLGFEGCLALVHRLAERRTRTRFGGSTVWSKREGGPAAGGGRNA